MSRYLLISDTHLGLYGASDFWLEIVIDFFKKIHDVCVKEDIKKIIHLGDFFNERKNTNTKTIDAAQKIERILSVFQSIIIVGNHDCYYKNKTEPTTLQIFKDSKSIDIVTDVLHIREDNLVLVPWGKMPNGFRGGICLGHFELSGFMMNLKRRCDKGQDLQQIMWNNFEMVLSGHFHMPQKENNVIYLGAPYQQSFRDSDDIERGYWILDTDGPTLDFIKYNDAPKFIKVNTSKEIKKEIVEGNFIKLIFDEDYGSVKNEKFLREIYDMKPLKVYPDFSKIEVNDEEIISEDVSLIDNDEIFMEYVDKQELPKNIKKPLLNSFVEQVIKEAYE